MYTKLNNIIFSLFKYTIVVYVVLYLIESIFKGFVLNNFDINILIIIAGFFGILSIPKTIHCKELIENKYTNIYIVLMSIFFGFYLYYLLPFEFIYKIFISLFSGFSLYIFLSLIFTKNIKKIKIKNKIKVKNITKILIGIISVTLIMLMWMQSKRNTIFEKLDPNITIKIYDVSEDKTKSENFTNKLNKYGYEKSYFGEIDAGSYKNIKIYSSQKNSDQVKIILKLLEDDYRNISIEPKLNISDKEIYVVFGSEVETK